MKYIFFFLLLALPLLSGPLQGEDKRTLDTKIADILNQIPARDAAHRDQLAAATLSLGTEGLSQMTAMVVPDGDADDTRVRTALSGLSAFAGQPGNSEARNNVSQAFVTALQRAKHSLVKQFFLYHLAFVGKNEIAAPIAQYLSDPDLCQDAVRVLLTLGTTEAADILQQAFPNTPPSLKPNILQGIAKYAQPSAAILLRAHVGDADIALRRPALRGLASIGSPVDAKTLFAAAKAVNFAYEPSEATRSLIIYLEALAQNDHLADCRKMALQIIRATANGPHSSSALAALDVLASYFGMDALDELNAALDHPDPKYRAAALQSASRIRDVAATRRLLAKAQAAGSELKSELLLHFAKIADPLAKPLVTQSLYAPDPRVRMAAFTACSTIFGKNSLPLLLKAAEKTRTSAEKTQLQELLLQTAGQSDGPALIESLKRANPAGQALLFEVLAARHVHSAFPIALSACANPNPEIAVAAYHALANLAQANNFSELINLLSDTSDPKRIQAVQAALVAIANADSDRQFLAVWQQKPQLRPVLLGCLPAIGGENLLSLVKEAYADNTLKSAAFQTLVQWKEPIALQPLFEVLQNTDEPTRQEGFRAILRIVGASTLPMEQKVLQLRKALAAASGQPALQSQAIAQLGRIKSFPALMAVAPFLDNPTLASDAAWAVARIALPGSDGHSGLFGETVRNVLEKALVAITGPESAYTAENIRSWLKKMPAEKGFISLFNGKDLSGWQGLVGNPISRAAMSPDKLAQAQKEADARLPENWSVQNGEIRFTGKGFENLCTTTEYADFEMWVDWFITRDGDSGIYLRGTPQVQIWDTSLVKVGAQVGSGGLYNNQKNPSKPLKVADNPVGEWNTFFIRMIGDKVTVILNGELVTDQVVLENYWNRNLPIFSSGPLELQAHGTNLAFRNIYVREITSANYQLSPEEIAEGYVPLFNGKDLDNWQGNKVDYKVGDQAIRIDPTAGGNGNLFTVKEYGDFSFRFEFQLTPGANNGIGIRTPLEGDAAYVGMEIQVLDNTSPIYAKLQPYQYHGSVYGVIPAKREYLKPVGEWNSEEIRIQGNHIRVTLNGTVIVDGDLQEASKNGTIDKNAHPGLQRKSGYIGFLGHGSEVRFRNIRIKEL